MPKVAKIAISLPENILEAVEKECIARGESRSQLFRIAVEEYLRHRGESESIERYIAGYKNIPETAIEVREIHTIGVVALAGEPW